MKHFVQMLTGGFILTIGFMTCSNPIQAQSICGHCYETPPWEIYQHCIDDTGAGWCGLNEDPGEDPDSLLVSVGIVACDNELDSACHHGFRGSGCERHDQCPLMDVEHALDDLYTALETHDVQAFAEALDSHDALQKHGSVVEVRSCSDRLVGRVPISERLWEQLFPDS